MNSGTPNRAAETARDKAITPVTRNARARDARAIGEAHVQSWQTAYRAFMPHEFLDALSVAEREKTWREAIELGNPKVLVVEAAGEIAGFCALGHCRDEAAGPDDYELWALYLAPSYWSHGLGLALWREALSRLESIGAQHVSLWVITDNTRATRFYRRVGFQRDDLPVNPVQVAGVVVPHQRYSAPMTELLTRTAPWQAGISRDDPTTHPAA